MLNAVSWGILMPIGAFIARYLKAFKSADPAWFYLHVGCQSIAYIVGVAGWGTGLKLGSESASIQYDAHRTIGIILFCLGTLQVIKKTLFVSRSFWVCHTCASESKQRLGLEWISGVRFASKAKTWSQVQILLEHLPPLSWIQCYHPQHHQHIQRIQHFEPW